MHRRRFLAQTAKVALGAKTSLLLGGFPAVSAWAASHDTALTGTDLETLAIMVRVLLPHEFLADEDYLRWPHESTAGSLATRPCGNSSPTASCR